MTRPKPPADFNENPVWTEEMHARAKPASDVLGPEFAAAMVRKRGRPALAADQRKRQVTLRLSPDVVDRLRADGPGWQARANEILRQGLNLKERTLLGGMVPLTDVRSGGKSLSIDAKKKAGAALSAGGDKRFINRDDQGQFLSSGGSKSSATKRA